MAGRRHPVERAGEVGARWGRGARGGRARSCAAGARGASGRPTSSTSGRVVVLRAELHGVAVAADLAQPDRVAVERRLRVEVGDRQRHGAERRGRDRSSQRHHGVADADPPGLLDAAPDAERERPLRSRRLRGTRRGCAACRESVTPVSGSWPVTAQRPTSACSLTTACAEGHACGPTPAVLLVGVDAVDAEQHPEPPAVDAPCPPPGRAGRVCRGDDRDACILAPVRARRPARPRGRRSAAVRRTPTAPPRTRLRRRGPATGRPKKLVSTPSPSSDLALDHEPSRKRNDSLVASGSAAAATWTSRPATFPLTMRPSSEIR